MRVCAQLRPPQLDATRLIDDLARLAKSGPQALHALAMSLGRHTRQAGTDQQVGAVGQCTGKVRALSLAGLLHALHKAVGQRAEDGGLHDCVEPQYTSGHGGGEHRQYFTAYVRQCLFESLPIQCRLASGQQAQVVTKPRCLPLSYSLGQWLRTACADFDIQFQTFQVRLGKRTAKSIMQNTREPGDALGPWLVTQQLVDASQVFKPQMPDKPTKLAFAMVLPELLQEMLEAAVYAFVPQKGSAKALWEIAENTRHLRNLDQEKRERNFAAPGEIQEVFPVKEQFDVLICTSRVSDELLRYRGLEAH